MVDPWLLLAQVEKRSREWIKSFQSVMLNHHTCPTSIRNEANLHSVEFPHESCNYLTRIKSRTSCSPQQRWDRESEQMGMSSPSLSLTLCLRRCHQLTVPANSFKSKPMIPMHTEMNSTHGVRAVASKTDHHHL